MYNVIPGDTYSTIARKLFGDEKRSDEIRQSNPGVTEPLQPGTSIIVPPPAQNKPHATAASLPDEVAILIDGKRFRFWEEVVITRAADRIDTVSFSAPFDPDSSEFAEKFVPFEYKRVVVTVGGQRLFTGQMMPPVSDQKNNKRIIQVDCYGLPGVLEDCTASPETYPIETSGLKLPGIAAKLAKPFGIDVAVIGDVGAVFDVESPAPGDGIFPHVAKLSSQRNKIISSTPGGDLLIWDPVEPGNPVAVLEEGFPPLREIEPRFNGRQYYSDVTGIIPTLGNLKGEKYTIRNPRLPQSFRPYVFISDDSESMAEVKVATESKFARMLSDAASYTLKGIPTWFDPSGNLWQPNTTIKVKAPGAMIYSSYEFIIRSVAYRRGVSSTVDLELVIPGALGGNKLPESMPWDR